MVFLTFDTDWTPAWLVRWLVERLGEAGLRATIFATDPLDLGPAGHVELALHPNLMPDTTQGGSQAEVLDNLRAWYPRARGVRTHRLYWHSGLAGEFLARGLTYDASLLLPLQPHLGPLAHNGFTRIPGWWSDNYHLEAGLPLDRVEEGHFEQPGWKVMGFHPVHVYLNTNSLAAYRRTLAALAPLAARTPAELAPYREDGPGIGAFFEALVRYLARRGTATRCLGEVLPCG